MNSNWPLHECKDCKNVILKSSTKKQYRSFHSTPFGFSLQVVVSIIIWYYSTLIMGGHLISQEEGVFSTLIKDKMAKDIYLKMWKVFVIWSEKYFVILVG